MSELPDSLSLLVAGRGSWSAPVSQGQSLLLACAGLRAVKPALTFSKQILLVQLGSCQRAGWQGAAGSIQLRLLYLAGVQQLFDGFCLLQSQAPPDQGQQDAARGELV